MTTLTVNVLTPLSSPCPMPLAMMSYDGLCSKTAHPPFAVSHELFFSPSTMAPAVTPSTDPPSKDPSKMSKSELLRLYKTTTTEKEELTKKCGQYPRVSHQEAPSVDYTTRLMIFIPGKVQKKYKNAKRALDATRNSNELAKRDLIPHPTGQTHGRGNFNLAECLFETSDVSKEDYNTFIVRCLVQLTFIC